jgi:CRISPR-associated protein (TIGR02710 family)
MTTPVSSPIAAVLVSVGGSPAPVLFTLLKRRPAHVWYFCSADSRQVADDIHAQLDWRPDRDFIEVERFEELGPCYKELRTAIPALLRKWKVPAAEVLVDYTGGTKTMSAALVLAATEVFSQFSYVGGAQRQQGGLGVTVDGLEKVFYQVNPWSDLAIREIERARDLWDGCLFDAAAQVLRATAARVPQRLRFTAVADVADAMAARHRLDFRRAVELLGAAGKALPALYDGQEDHELLAWVRHALTICDACTKPGANPVFLRELLDNTLRTAAQGRFEDAAARLYRAMEMQGQIWLAEATQGAFQNGKLKSGTPLPAALAALSFCRPEPAREVCLSLEQLYLALHQLGDARAARVATDVALETNSRWRQATEKRNTSILAHGVQPVGDDGFNQMKAIAVGFLGFDLGRQANPIPPLDTRWLSANP